MKQFKEKVAVITGAASGIGRCLVLNLAAEGCHLAISDINAEELQETMAMVENKSIQITSCVVDVADRQQVFGFADQVMADHKRVDLVINNAGTAMFGSLAEVSLDEFEWLMGINFWGVVYGSMAFLPHLQSRPEANLVNISSVHGLFTNPGCGPYCSSKFAVSGFTQTLCQEMKDSSVTVSCVHPGGIRTGIVFNRRIAEKSVEEQTPAEAQEDFDKALGKTSADEAAKIILRGIKKNKTRILVGRDAYIYDFLARFVPATWQKIMGRLPDILERLARKEV